MKRPTDIRSKRMARPAFRGSQVIFGERRQLEEVRRSVERAGLPAQRKQRETRLLKKLIQARTDELNRVNPGWDRKFARARDPRTGTRQLLALGAKIPPEDYLLARTLAEHPAAPADLLELLANHPYSAVRERVARHPNTPAPVLERLANDSREPLWFLVACNPSISADLRARLKARMQQAPSAEVLPQSSH